MAAPAKQTSRWGNFLQQAVAGVESRLDNILAEGVEGQAQTQAGQKKPGTPTLPASPSKTDGGAYCIYFGFEHGLLGRRGEIVC